MKKLFIYLLIMCVAVQSSAQEIDCTFGVDSNEVWIGDYINCTFSVTYPTDKYAIVFPNINDFAVAPFSIIKQSSIDTSQSAGLTTLLQTTTIASYDSGLFVLQGLPIQGFNTITDSAVQQWTDSIVIKVSNVPINPNGDFKDIITPKTTINYLHYILIVLACIVIISLIIVGIIYLIKRNKSKPKRLENPYNNAIENLKKIKPKNILDIENQKIFYSTLTQICKSYLQDRCNIYTTDKTTFTTIEKLKNNDFTKPVLQQWHSIFTEADLVKFAKLSTTFTQQEHIWQTALDAITTVEKNYQTHLQEALKNKVPNE
jgi:hypothetical protein